MLLDTLRHIVGPTQVLVPEESGDGLAAYTHDWRKRWKGRPLAVVRPGSTAEVAAVVRACAAAGTAIVPQGGKQFVFVLDTEGDGETKKHLSRKEQKEQNNQPQQ